MPLTSQCALCQEVAPLRESHVLPAFVYRWLKERSITGHIRRTDMMNRRVQDGLKKPWLCENCEQRFSHHEVDFANRLFRPWLSGKTEIRYNDWLLRFCVSISWRVLKHCKGLNPKSVYTDDQENLARQAEATWRAFLLDRAPHPAQFEQHLMIHDLIEETSISDLPNNINRYLMGAVEMDIVGSGRTLMSYAKLGRFTIFGLIQKGPDKWEGTKIHVKNGLLKPGHFTVPHSLIGLFKDKAAQLSASYRNISEAQNNKIDDLVMKNLDRVTDSDQLAAMMADAEMFGEGAILRRPKRTGGC
jgi:hypothetical protein